MTYGFGRINTSVLFPLLKEYIPYKERCAFVGKLHSSKPRNNLKLRLLFDILAIRYGAVTSTLQQPLHDDHIQPDHLRHGIATGLNESETRTGFRSYPRGNHLTTSEF